MRAEAAAGLSINACRLRVGLQVEAGLLAASILLSPFPTSEVNMPMGVGGTSPMLTWQGGSRGPGRNRPSACPPSSGSRTARLGARCGCCPSALWSPQTAPPPAAGMDQRFSSHCVGAHIGLSRGCPLTQCCQGDLSELTRGLAYVQVHKAGLLQHNQTLHLLHSYSNTQAQSWPLCWT